MKNTTRVIALIGAIMMVAALGVTAYAANSTGGTPTPATTVPPSDDRTQSPSPSDANELKGNCDEAEHANDPQCQGGVVNDDDNSGPGNGDDEQVDDNSGPSDDSGSGGNDDNSGHDAGDDHGGDDDLIRG